MVIINLNTTTLTMSRYSRQRMETFIINHSPTSKYHLDRCQQLRYSCTSSIKHRKNEIRVIIKSRIVKSRFTTWNVVSVGDLLQLPQRHNYIHFPEAIEPNLS